MNDGEIKTMLNREVLSQIKDDTTRYILKNILFNDGNIIDWKEVYKIVMAFMPELKVYDGYKMEN